jgi:plastocyanin
LIFKEEEEMKKHFAVTIAVLLLVLLGLFALDLSSSTGSQSNTTAEVKIDNFSFTPETINVNAGTTVTWVNQDDVPHTVASDEKIFKSRALDTDEKFAYTFTKPGTYAYFCSLHPKMIAKIVVR